MKRIIIIQLCCLLIAILAGKDMQAQTAAWTISGTVTDGSLPLDNVSVYEKDITSNGAVTNEKGYFKLTLRGQSHVIVVSRVGYIKLEMKVSSRDPLSIKLQSDVKGLEDVVVLGYGQTKKVTLTGAVSSISGQEIRQSPSASLQNTLVGRLPGLFSEQRSGQPGSDAAAIQIRGVSSYTSSSTPLIIVDDIEFAAAQLSQIDPNEVESLTILKDASTTAVYGIRGANGVVIIRTRRGKSGKPQLTVRNETGLQMPTARPKVNDGYTTLQLLKEYLLVQGKDPAVEYPLFFSGNSLDYYKNNSDPLGHPNVNWWDELLKKTSVMNRVDFDISGGSNIVKYFMSFSYLTQGGIYKDFTKDQGYNGNYFYNRYNFRSNIDIDPNKSLHIRLDLSGRFGIQNRPNDLPFNGGGSTFQYLWNGELSSFGYPVYNPDGSFGGTAASNTKGNPIANLTQSGYVRSYNNNLNLVASATQKLDFITPGLSAYVLLSVASDLNYTRSLTRSSTQILTYSYNPVTQVYTPNIANLYRLPPPSRSGSPAGSSQLLNVQASLNYVKSFGNHNVNGQFLLNQNSNLTNTASTPGTPVKYRGFTARVGYNYKLKYLFDVVAGYNGSDRFQSSKKYGLFPAVSAGWNISEEPFFKDNIKFITTLKFRGSYGLVGSDNIGGFNYLYQQVYNTGQTGYNFGTVSTPASGVTEGALGNSDVTWEKVRKTDIGMDMKLFKGAISITADYFHDYRYDILTTRGTIPAPFGVGLPPVNLGKVVNQGYELDIRYNGRKGKLTYFIDAQVSYAKNKIIYMDEPAKLYPWLAQTGKPIGQQFGYVYTGFYQNVAELYSTPTLTTAVPLVNLYPGALKLADLNKDGIVDQNDQSALGTNQPTYTGGMSMGLSYKGFDISVLFQGAFGNVININRGVLSYNRADRQSVPFNLGRWTPENAATATYPSLAPSVTNFGTAGSTTSSFWLRKGDYIRFKNFEIGYTIPASVFKKWNLKNVRVYANGYNIGLIYVALPVFVDPESAVSTTVGEYPQQRIINFGFQVGL